MQKVSFLGWDVTPRKALWQRIENLTKEVEALSNCLDAAENDKLQALRECQVLQDKVKRREQTRSKDGKFAQKLR